MVLVLGLTKIFAGAILFWIEVIKMIMGEECRGCLIRSQLKKVRSYGDDPRVGIFERRVHEEVMAWTEEAASSIIMRRINAIHKEIFGEGIDYSKEKRELNAAILAIEDEIYSEIKKSDEPLFEAICYAQAGNYIDYATMSDIDKDSALRAVFEARGKSGLPGEVYSELKEDLSSAEKLTVLLDNCGEIVFDKLLIKTVKELYPAIDVTAVVRGKAIVNDVTEEDAHQIGLYEVCRVIGNGTDIPGTHLPEINEETLEALKGADLIISKGLGNFGTFEGNGYNVYFMFLTKCGYVAKKTGIPYMSPGLLHERGTN